MDMDLVSTIIIYSIPTAIIYLYYIGCDNAASSIAVWTLIEGAAWAIIGCRDTGSSIVLGVITIGSALAIYFIGGN